MEPAAKMYSRLVTISTAAVKGDPLPEGEQVEIAEAMDIMLRWFCILFGNQFTPDDVLNAYPVDMLIHARYCAGAYGCTDADHGDPFRVPYEGSGNAVDEGNSSGDPVVTLPDFIYFTYNSLLEGG